LSFPYQEGKLRRGLRQTWGFFVIAWILFQYKLSQIGLARRPHPVDTWQYPPGLSFIDFFLGLGRNTRVLGAENVPPKGPAIFASNHVRLDDPFVIGNAVHWISGQRIRVRVMMRNDFFGKLPGWAKAVFDPDDVASMVGAILVKRKDVEKDQLLPFIDVLLDDETFIIFSGRSRTRSGIVFEYREWIRSPGATSYFVAEAQNRRPDVPVPVYPIMHTINPVSGGSALHFGKPLFLEPTEDRVVQREFDYKITAAIADLIEMNVPHIVSVLLYLRCLHQLSSVLNFDELVAEVRQVVAQKPHPYIDPAVKQADESEIKETISYFEKAGLLRMNGGEITLNPEAILFSPELKGYRRANPLKFLANHMIHLPRVIAAAETVLLPAKRS
jgi:hypothetical protein